MNRVELIVEELAELETEVGIAGSVKQQEVGGAACIGVSVFVVMML